MNDATHIVKMDINNTGFAIYSKLKTTLTSGFEDDVSKLLRRDRGVNRARLHDYMCQDLPQRPAVCSRCASLLMMSIRQTVSVRNTHKLRLLLEYGAYPSEEICAARYPYNHVRSTPLKRAVQRGSLADVRQLLTSQKAADDDVNWHPRFCVRRPTLRQVICADCDTPLMAAVRRQDIAMMRLLIAHGANVSENVSGDFDGFCKLIRKTAFLVALCTKNQEVITELVTSGADVNQSFGPIGTALHWWHSYSRTVQTLAGLGADPNLASEHGATAVSLVLRRCHVSESTIRSSARGSLRTLLPATRDLDAILRRGREQRSGIIHNKCVTMFLQHGARIGYCTMYLTECYWVTRRRLHSKTHSERFIELLRAADTDFSGVRERIATVHQEDCKRLNLAVLDQKLSQPLTLQAWCVISVRLQLRRVKDCGLWASIEKLPLPTIIKDRLRLKTW